MENERKSGNPDGNLRILQHQVRESGAGVIISQATAELQPDVWSTIPDLHRGIINEGNRMLMDTSGNIVFQREYQEKAD